MHVWSACNGPPPFEVLSGEAKMNQLPAFASHNLARKTGKKKHLFKETNETDFFLKEQKKKTPNVDASLKERLTVTRRSEKYLFGGTGFLN